MKERNRRRERAARRRRGSKHPTGRFVDGGAQRAVLADQGILHGAQVRHEAAQPAFPRGHRRLEGVQNHEPGSQAASGTGLEVVLTHRDRLADKLLNPERVLPLLPNHPSPLDIRTTAVNLALVSGFRPTKRQPLTDDAIVTRAWQVIKVMIWWEEARNTFANALIRELGVFWKHLRDISIL